MPLSIFGGVLVFVGNDAVVVVVVMVDSSSDLWPPCADDFLLMSSIFSTCSLLVDAPLLWTIFGCRERKRRNQRERHKKIKNKA